MYLEIVKSKDQIKYRTNIVINGKKINSPLFVRKTDCREWLSEKRAEKAKMKLFGDLHKFYVEIKFDEYAKNWLEIKKIQGMSRSTIANYERYVRVHFNPFFQNRVLKTIQKSDVEKLQAHLKHTHNPKGVNLIITALKGIFKEAIKDGYILKSPCDYIKMLSSDNDVLAFWSKEEVNQFLSANVENELYDFFLVALNTAGRRGELAGLKIDRVNFQDNTISITRTRDKYELKERTKTNMKRVIPMNPIVRATMLKLCKNRNSDEFVFVNKDGEPINPHHLYRDFAKAQRIAGMKRILRIHDLRHVAASQFVINGGSIYDLRLILGHSTISTTEIYSHLSMDHMQNVMSKFSLGSVNEKINENENSDGKNLILLNDFKKNEENSQNSPKTLEGSF